MLRLGNLKKTRGATKKEKRRGRGPGSKTGDTSTRGHKGLRARKSGNARPGYEGGQTPLYRRIPKRGFRNIFSIEFAVVNVGDLERFGLDQIDLENLKSKRLVKSKHSLLKVLGNGEITKAVTVKANKFTKSAIEKIEKAGGKAEVVDGGR